MAHLTERNKQYSYAEVANKVLQPEKSATRLTDPRNTGESSTLSNVCDYNINISLLRFLYYSQNPCVNTMAEELEKTKQYKYQSNANLVIQRLDSGIPRESGPTGESSTLSTVRKLQ